MRKKTIILILIFIGYIALCNYGIYSYRIKGEYWEVKDLIFFLGILNIAIINPPILIYLAIIERKEEKQRKELALLLVKENWLISFGQAKSVVKVPFLNFKSAWALPPLGFHPPKLVIFAPLQCTVSSKSYV